MAYEKFTDSLPGETWRNTGYRGYEVSNMGRVRSSRGRSLRIKKAVPDKDGYLRVSLGSRGEDIRGNYSVHRLVLEAFRGPCPEDCEADHRDDDRGNNRLTNLRWLHRDKNMDRRNTAYGARNPTSAANEGGVQCECIRVDGLQCLARAYRLVMFSDDTTTWMCGPHLGSAKRQYAKEIIAILTPEEAKEIDN